MYTSCARTDYVIAFSRKGSPETIEETISRLSEKQRPAVVIGGFPHGHFSETTIRLADEVVWVDTEVLETWTSTSRVMYEYERAISQLKRSAK